MQNRFLQQYAVNQVCYNLHLYWISLERLRIWSFHEVLTYTDNQHSISDRVSFSSPFFCIDFVVGVGVGVAIAFDDEWQEESQAKEYT